MLNEEIFSEMELSLLTNPSAPLYQEYLWSFFELSYFKICTGSFWRYVAHFLLFNCKGWSADRKEPFIQKRHTLYLPVILIGGPICRHMLLFYVKLCHRTHPFLFRFSELCLTLPLQNQLPCRIFLPLSVSAFCENRRHNQLTLVPAFLWAFLFPLSSFLTLPAK